MTGINWHSGLICAEYWSRGYRENACADFSDVPVPASQLVALQKKLEQAKAQLERKATKPVKRKVSSLERKRFLARRCSVISGSKKRQAPAERSKKEIFRLLKGQGSYLNDSYLLVWVLQKKISNYY